MKTLSLIFGLLLLGCSSVTNEVKVAPKGSEDMTHAVMDSVRRVNDAGGGRVCLASGDYHFYSASATPMRFAVSNHDQPEERPIFLPLVGVTNVVIEADNARFVMHGMGTAMLLQNTERVGIKGVTVEWKKPFFAQGEILGFEDGGTRIRFAERHHVEERDGQLVLNGEDWEAQLFWGNLFDAKTHEMIERTSDIGVGPAKALPDGTFLIKADYSRAGAGAKKGDVIVLRDFYRPHPVICLNHAKDTEFRDFVFRDGFGMGILAQLSENFTLSGGGSFPRGPNEYASNTIDATHFSNCRGTITVENCRFEGMMDDALNVHSTSLAIVAKPAADTIRCQFMHAQSIGLDLFHVGESLRFIAGKTLENGPTMKVQAVEVHDEREITLKLAEPVPSEYGIGDAVENADWQCAVVFRKNHIANNRARGVLFTTPKRIVCEDNFFDHVSGSAILLAGDAQGWYESGSCEDVVIRRNRFTDCLTSAFQYCNGIVSIYPEVKDIAAQKRRYHRNITIEDNEIETFDVPLLYAVSAEDVHWRRNHVIRHNRYRGWRKPPFDTRDCDKLEIK